MRATTYIKKYHDDKTKMFCLACRLPTMGPAWRVAAYLALKTPEYYEKYITSDEYTKNLYYELLGGNEND